MRPYSMFCFVALAISIYGCHAPQTSPELAQGENFSSDSHSVRISDIATPIASTCDKLGITIEESTEEAKRYEATCKSMTGLDVRFEAVAVVPGKTLVLITVRGDKRVIVSLTNYIRDTLRDEIHSFYEDR